MKVHIFRININAVKLLFIFSPQILTGFCENGRAYFEYLKNNFYIYTFILFMTESSYKKFSPLLLLLIRGMECMIVISSGGTGQGNALHFSEIQNNYH